MQRIKYRMENAILNMYGNMGNISDYGSADNQVLNYSYNNIFSIFFRVHLQGNKFELPIFGKAYIQNLIRCDNSIELKDVVIPFYPAPDDHIFRTSDTLIRYLSNWNSGKNGMCVSAKTTKGEKYYGCNGIILNSDMVPLFMNVIECEIFDNRKIVYNKVKSYVHPSVFYLEGLIEKCIVNKIIPYVLKNGIRVSSSVRIIDNIKYFNNEGYLNTIPEIIVADIGDKFFCKPILKNTTYSNDDLNEVLERNMDDIFNIIRINEQPSHDSEAVF